MSCHSPCDPTVLQHTSLFHMGAWDALFPQEEGALAGDLYDGLQQTIQNPGAGSATHAGIPVSRNAAWLSPSSLWHPSPVVPSRNALTPAFH